MWPAHQLAGPVVKALDHVAIVEQRQIKRTAVKSYQARSFQ